jgi:hypothetical protein
VLAIASIIYEINGADDHWYLGKFPGNVANIFATQFFGFMVVLNGLVTIEN